MESRANHLLIGVFVLLGVAGLFAVVIWLGRVQIAQETNLYRIHFEESVYGLNTGGDVRYRGIRVGSVRDIRVNPRDPRRAEVLVDIQADTPIRVGDVATLALQGITGLVYVNIKGAGPDDPLLAAEEGREIPMIPSRRSEIAEFVNDAPELLNRAITVLDRLALFIDERNRENVSAILEDLAGFTNTLAGRGESLDRLLGNVERTSANLDQASAAIRDLSDNANALLRHADGTLTRADELLGTDAEKTLTTIAEAADAIRQLADTGEKMLEENREPLRNFAYDGLNEFERFVNEARLLVESLTRLTDQVESRGAGAFFGRGKGEVRPER